MLTAGERARLREIGRRHFLAAQDGEAALADDLMRCESAIVAAIEAVDGQLLSTIPTPSRVAQQAAHIEAAVRRVLHAMRTAHPFVLSRVEADGVFGGLAEIRARAQRLSKAATAIDCGPPTQADAALVLGVGLRMSDGLIVRGFISDLTAIWMEHAGRSPAVYAGGPFVDFVVVCRDVTARLGFGDRGDGSLTRFIGRTDRDRLGLWLKRELRRLIF